MPNKKMKHRHIDGLSIELLSETSKGWKVRQTELYAPWGSRKLRKPKVKTAFYSDAEISELFKNE